MRNFIISLLSVLMASLSVNSVYADTSIALSKGGDFYRYSGKTISQASEKALKYCEATTHSKCKIIYNSKKIHLVLGLLQQARPGQDLVLDIIAKALQRIGH
jgi:hypothetical protein